MIPRQVCLVFRRSSVSCAQTLKLLEKYLNSEWINSLNNRSMEHTNWRTYFFPIPVLRHKTSFFFTQPYLGTPDKRGVNRKDATEWLQSTSNCTTD